MTDDIVSIKGIKDGLLIALSPTEDWQSITRELATKIDEKLAFFKGARVTVNVGERPVPKYDLTSLKALLERRALTLIVVQSSSATTIESAHALDLRANVPQDSRQQKNDLDDDLHDALPIDSEEHGTVGVMIKRTLRSGRTIHSRGHVIVFGDVNPGAKIIATGDIIIWGKLRGMVHAGAEGDTSAVICALDMSPNQLRIADLIATAPSDKRHKVNPEVASVRDEQIVVETWG
ncbi:MAG: septum site-determining protein MinC [Anaerolineae bacterium]|nr:septum site-determining protein MinC [Anaerolineae bacterium]MDQ7034955.1 septum site-determining protein MinC [Anaerolineae bacterium]